MTSAVAPCRLSWVLCSANCTSPDEPFDLVWSSPFGTAVAALEPLPARSGTCAVLCPGRALVLPGRAGCPASPAGVLLGRCHCSAAMAPLLSGSMPSMIRLLLASPAGSMGAAEPAVPCTHHGAICCVPGSHVYADQPAAHAAMVHISGQLHAEHAAALSELIRCESRCPKSSTEGRGAHRACPPAVLKYDMCCSVSSIRGVQHLTCCSMRGSCCSISIPAAGSAGAAAPACGVARRFAGFCLASLTTEAPSLGPAGAQAAGACSAAGCLLRRLGLGAAAAFDTRAAACSAAGGLLRRFGLGPDVAGARDALSTPVARGWCAWLAMDSCSFGASRSSRASSSVACWRTSLKSQCMVSELPSSACCLISAAAWLLEVGHGSVSRGEGSGASPAPFFVGRTLVCLTAPAAVTAAMVLQTRCRVGQPTGCPRGQRSRLHKARGAECSVAPADSPSDGWPVCMLSHGRPAGRHWLLS